MSSKSSKRQHARNEKVIQDLIKSVNGNDRCADCGANNTGVFATSSGVMGVMGVADVASGSLRGLSREKIANGE